jgi:hypothetical protein
MSTLIALSRDSGYADRTRKYRVLLDGVEVGRIANGEVQSIPVASGTHRLQLKIDWCSSNAVDFTAQVDQIAKFHCSSALRGWRVTFALFVVLLNPRGYLRLTRVET